MMETAADGVMRPGGLALTARAVEYCAFAPGAKIVDVGCGTGVTVEFLRTSHGLNAIGIDRSAVILERGLQRNPNLPLLQGCGERLPLAVSCMDSVFAECTLSLMEDRRKALAEFHRVLVPGGRLIVTGLYARRVARMEGVVPPVSCLAGMTTREELSRDLENAGFLIELWEDHTPRLKEFVIRMIMEHGSLQPFWEFDCSSGNAREIQEAVKEAKPGYFLLVGRRTQETRDTDER
jgi:ubiquinone/menaquinone biosynthesis C-methylase UbiE